MSGELQSAPTQRKMRDDVILLVLALLVGAIFDYLFYDKPLGISFPLFTLVSLAVIWTALRNVFSMNRDAALLLIPIVLLSATFGLYSNPVLLSINFMLVPLLAVVHTIIAGGMPAWWKGSMLIEVLDRSIAQPVINIARPFKIAAQTITANQGPQRAALIKVLAGLIFSIPILVIVIPLLTSADQVFADYVGKVDNIWKYVDAASTIWQTILILTVTSLFFGFLWSFLHRRPEKPGATEQRPDAGTWDITIVITMLAVFDLVYMAFSAVQFAYLYGGANHALPEGFTYAQYARRGFWELLTVGIINLTIFLAVAKWAVPKSRTSAIMLGSCLILLIVFSLNMLFAAHFKMSLYEEAFGLTYLRFFTHYFMLFMFVLFALALAKVFVPRIALIKNYLVVGLAFYVVLNFLGVDNWIARHNLSMAMNANLSSTEKAQAVDSEYLVYGLSYDAVPAIADYLEREPDGKGAPGLKVHLKDVRTDLSRKKPWQSYNLSKARALAAARDALSK